MFARKQEARTPYVRVVELNELSVDPVPWGLNWPHQFDGWKSTAGDKFYGRSSALPASKPDGTPGEHEPVFPQPPPGGFTGEFAGEPVPEDHPTIGEAHPVTCIDCHDPATMAIRVTRPGFMNGIRSLAEGDGAVPHLPSIDQWRRGSRSVPYDPNVHASRQEMRSFVCGQCHVEYYCGDKMTLIYPWKHGLQLEELERTWEETTFSRWKCVCRLRTR